MTPRATHLDVDQLDSGPGCQDTGDEDVVQPEEVLGVGLVGPGEKRHCGAGRHEFETIYICKGPLPPGEEVGKARTEVRVGVPAPLLSGHCVLTSALYPG